MKIKKFNESLNSKLWKPTDKILKGTIYFEVNTKTIEQTDAYQRSIDRSDNTPEDIRAARHYGIEDYIYTHGTDMDFELVDGLGNPIENEIEFDNEVKNIKKYNV